MKRKPYKFPARIQCEKDIPSTLSLDAECNLQAATEENKVPRITMVANTGKPMRVKGFYDPVVVSIKGAKFDKKTTPIIMDHDTKLRLGHTDSQTIDKDSFEIKAEGLVSSSSQTAKDFLADSKSGYPFQVSIGADVLEAEYVEEGQSISVNGKTYEGPLVVATKTLIRELSVTVLGADNDTSATIKAKLSKERKCVMGFEAYVASLGLELSALTDDQKTKIQAEYDRMKKLEKLKNPKKPTKVKAQDPEEEEDEEEEDKPAPRSRVNASREDDAADEERRDRIKEIAAEYSDELTGVEIPYGKKKLTLSALKANALRDGEFTADAFELLVVKASRTNRPDGPAPQMVNKEITSRALECAILRSMEFAESAVNPHNGKKHGLATMYDEKTLEASHLPQYQCGGSIQALFDMQIRAVGMSAPSDRNSKNFYGQAFKAWSKAQELNASGFSVITLTNLLENVANKVAQESFAATEGVWSLICGRKSLNDFKATSMYRLDPSGSYKKIGVDGELKHVSMVDTKTTLQADAYGAMITIDYKTMRNDDLGLVLDMCRSLGMLGAQRIEESVFVTLLGAISGGAFFTSGRGNYRSGGGSALSLTSLETARVDFKNQIINNKPINVSPRLLLTGTTLETTAGHLYKEEKLAATGDTDALVFTNNPNAGLYKPVISGYLNNTGIKDEDGAALTGQSSTQWGLLADPRAPQGAMINIGFLDGRDTPYFDEAETQFNIPNGMQFRSYLYWGVAMGTYQMGHWNAGA